MESVDPAKVLLELEDIAVLRLIMDLENVAMHLRHLEHCRRSGTETKTSVVDRLLSSLAPLGYELLALAGEEPSLPVLDPQDLTIKESAEC